MYQNWENSGMHGENFVYIITNEIKSFYGSLI